MFEFRCAADVPVTREFYNAEYIHTTKMRNMCVADIILAVIAIASAVLIYLNGYHHIALPLTIGIFALLSIPFSIILTVGHYQDISMLERFYPDVALTVAYRFDEEKLITNYIKGQHYTQINKYFYNDIESVIENGTSYTVTTLEKKVYEISKASMTIGSVIAFNDFLTRKLANRFVCAV